MNAITDRQSEILAFIIRFWQEKQTSPTYRSIAEEFGININAVTGHIRALREKGLLKDRQTENGKNMARAIIPVDMPSKQETVVIEDGFVVVQLSEDSVMIAIHHDGAILHNGIHTMAEMANMAKNNGLEPSTLTETAAKLCRVFLPRLKRKILA